MTSIADKIRLKQMELAMESDPQTKHKMQLQLQKLQLHKEIELIKKRIEQLG